MLETPALETVIALVGIHLAALLYLHYRRAHDEPTAATATRGPESEPADQTDGTDAVVECGDCGAENDPSYRYCRRCVADLSSDSVPGHRGRSPSGRLF